jgi:hypothetical protein
MADGVVVTPAAERLGEGKTMKGGAQAALALGVGYILGRRRKMRLATMLAIGAATGGIGGLGPAALRRGAKYLGSTDIAGALGPQVGEIVSTVRGELLDAAKGAATAAVTNRIDSLSDSLHDRAETLRNPEAAMGRAGETVGEAAGQASGRLGRLRRRGQPVDDEEAAEPDRDDERGNGQARRERPRVRRGTRSEADEAEEPRDEYEEPRDEYEDEPSEDELDEAPADEFDDEDEAEEPARPRRRTARSPVARTRR